MLERHRGIVTKTDSYKAGGHFNMYPDNTTLVYSYFEARKGARFDRTVFFELQYLLKERLVGTVVTQKMINKAHALCTAHLGSEYYFNKEGWQYILDVHNGRLPLSIKAVPEGTAVPVDNVLFTVENTDPKCFWLTNYVESFLSHVWYGSTVATLAKSTKDMIFEYLCMTSEKPEESIDFALHDFGYRGGTCDEAAEIAGGAHQLSFKGTDTLTGIEFLMDFYGGGVDAFSVIATEHSIMTAEGRAGEFKVVQRLLDKYPTGILSVVIDSYNWKNFVEVTGTKFKEQILGRDGKFVFRPDSGPPVETTLELLGMLDTYFGSSVNDKGYKVLNPKIGVLWGDGINKKGIQQILIAIIDAGWCASNLVFGQGGALHQSQVERDTQKCAFKSSYQVRGGESFNIFKDPLDGSKKSKKGRLALIIEDGEYKTLQEVTGPVEGDLLVEVFRDGDLLVEYTADEVRANLNSTY